MPAFPEPSLFPTIVARNTSTLAANAASNVTASAPLQVICAWPVSGQYGPGSRVLYYVLVAACIFARKAEWLRNACLAAALLVPAVAACHGITLAIVHYDDAVDLDVYGAFQLCAIGILAAPVTVRLSRTYFNDPGRNAIFLWTGLVLAGLLSLTVAFFRLSTKDCSFDETYGPISSDPRNFPYNATCGLQCDTNYPVSPMRGGSANNIYVIPAPQALTFGTATLLSAACCIPAILQMVSMWNKILEINWKSRFRNRNQADEADEPIEGTNGATPSQMRGINDIIRKFMSAVEIPLFAAAVLAILIIGEKNFFSTQVHYQTEPMASVGQWAPIVGAGFAILGSLYLLLAADFEALEKEENPQSPQMHHHCNCSTHHVNRSNYAASFHSVSPPDHSRSAEKGHTFTHDNEARADSTEIEPVQTRPTGHELHPTQTMQSYASSMFSSSDTGGRHRVARILTVISDQLGAAAHTDNTEFKRGKALDFPEIPGEANRNKALSRIRETYNQARDDDGNVTPLRRTRSRAGSFIGVVEDEPRSPTTPQSPSQPIRPPTNSRDRSNTLPVQRNSSEQRDSSTIPPVPATGNTPQRRATLEVPAQAYHRPTRSDD